MSIDAQREQEDKVREDLNRHSGFCDACEGQALALRAPRRVFFVGRGPVPAVPSPRLKQDLQDEQDEQDEPQVR